MKMSLESCKNNKGIVLASYDLYIIAQILLRTLISVINARVSVY